MGSIQQPLPASQPARQAAVVAVLCSQWPTVMLTLMCALQELQQQLEHEAASARSERKKRENAERMCRQAVEDKVCCRRACHACERSNTWVKGLEKQPATTCWTNASTMNIVAYKHKHCNGPAQSLQWGNQHGAANEYRSIVFDRG